MNNCLKIIGARLLTRSLLMAAQSGSVCLASHSSLIQQQERQQQLQQKQQQFSFNQIRFYSKKPKAGGEKGGKGGKPKVQLTSEELNHVINFDELISDFRKAVEHLRGEYNESISLRLTPSVFEQLNVKTPNGFVKLGEIATVDIKNQNMFTINMIHAPEYLKAVQETIVKANLNCNPVVDKISINLPIPKITREHRENLAKAIKAKCDNTMKRLRDLEGKALRKAKENKKVSKDLSFNVTEYIKFEFEKYSKEANDLKDKKTSEILDEKH